MNDNKIPTSRTSNIASIFARIAFWTFFASFLITRILPVPILVLLLCMTFIICGIIGLIFGIIACRKLTPEEKAQSAWKSKTSKHNAVFAIIIGCGTLIILTVLIISAIGRSADY